MEQRGKQTGWHCSVLTGHTFLSELCLSVLGLVPPATALEASRGCLCSHVSSEPPEPLMRAVICGDSCGERPWASPSLWKFASNGCGCPTAPHCSSRSFSPHFFPDCLAQASSQEALSSQFPSNSFFFFFKGHMQHCSGITPGQLWRLYEVLEIEPRSPMSQMPSPLYDCSSPLEVRS